MSQIYIGYWYQRTILHLNEVKKFLYDANSDLDLDNSILHELRDQLDIKSVTEDFDVFVHLEIKTNSGYTIRVYEDGLIIADAKFIEESDLEKLEDYVSTKLIKTFKYLFSLGAPTPIELINLELKLPCFLVTSRETKNITSYLEKYSDEHYTEIKSKDYVIKNYSNLYYIKNKNSIKVNHLIESLIYFQEFQSQMQKYLDLHRDIWEKIDKLNNKEYSGREVVEIDKKLQNYSLTINLINSRLSQMDVYLNSRKKLIISNKWEDLLSSILEFKYNNLDNTLNYLKTIWSMTEKHVNSSKSKFDKLADQATPKTIRALTVLTSLGVVGQIFGYLKKEEYPSVTFTGVIYLGISILIAVLLDKLIRYVYRNRQYMLEVAKVDKGLKS